MRAMQKESRALVARYAREAAAMACGGLSWRWSTVSQGSDCQWQPAATCEKGQRESQNARAPWRGLDLFMTASDVPLSRSSSSHHVARRATVELGQRARQHCGPHGRRDRRRARIQRLHCHCAGTRAHFHSSTRPRFGSLAAVCSVAHWPIDHLTPHIRWRHALAGERGRKAKGRDRALV
jgi:hypothetical protein